MPSNTAAFLRRELTAYRRFGPSLKLLGSSASPDAVNYLDLLPDAPGASRAKMLPDGVAGKPRPSAALRGGSRPTCGRAGRARSSDSRPTAGPRQPGRTGVPGDRGTGPTPRGSDGALRDKPPPGVLYRAGTDEASTLFSRLGLVLAEIGGEPDHPDYLFDEMLRLLTHAANGLVEKGIDKDDVLSLVGRRCSSAFFATAKS